MRSLSGQNQTGTINTALAESLAVRIADPDGAGIPGMAVAWSVTGGGSIHPATSVTDADGRAAAQRVLGAELGVYATTATAADAQGSPVVFLATAAPGAPDGDESKLQASPTTLEASTGNSRTTVTVTVRDRQGQPVPNVLVVLSATGEANALVQPTAPTDAQGVATGSFSSTATGNHVISATAGGVSIDQTAKVKVTPGPVDRTASGVVVPSGTAGVTTTITARLVDGFGNVITGEKGKFDVGVSGANVHAKLSIAEVAAGEYAATYTPTQAGNDVVQVVFNGVALGGPFTSAVAPGAASPAKTTAVVDPVATIFSPDVDIAIGVRDAFGNLTHRSGEPITVTAVLGNDRRAVSVDYDPNTGAYAGSFRPWATGTFDVEIAVNGTPISGSPFQTVRRTF